MPTRKQRRRRAEGAAGTSTSTSTSTTRARRSRSTPAEAGPGAPAATASADAQARAAKGRSTRPAREVAPPSCDRVPQARALSSRRCSSSPSRRSTAISRSSGRLVITAVYTALLRAVHVPDGSRAVPLVLAADRPANAARDAAKTLARGLGDALVVAAVVPATGPRREDEQQPARRRSVETACRSSGSNWSSVPSLGVDGSRRRPRRCTLPRRTSSERVLLHLVVAELLARLECDQHDARGRGPRSRARPASGCRRASRSLADSSFACSALTRLDDALDTTQFRDALGTDACPDADTLAVGRRLGAPEPRDRWRAAEPAQAAAERAEGQKRPDRLTLP